MAYMYMNSNNSFSNDLYCLVFQLCQELADVRAKRALIEAVMEETKQLQEVGGYPFYQISHWLFH